MELTSQLLSDNRGAKSLDGDGSEVGEGVKAETAAEEEEEQETLR